MAYTISKGLAYTISKGLAYTISKGLAYIITHTLQGNNARKVNCGCVYSAYILKPVLSGRNL